VGDKDGDQERPQVELRSLQELTSEAVGANISQLPRILEAFQQFGPEFAEAALASFEAANPQLASVIRDLAPLISTRAQQAATGQLPPLLLEPFRQNIRAAQAGRGLAESPISAVSEARQLGELAEEFARSTITGGTTFASQVRQGQAPSLASLGLELPGLPGQVGRAERLDETRRGLTVQAVQGEDETSRLIGELVGGAGGFALGGPGGAAAGAEIGGAIGGTFF